MPKNTSSRAKCVSTEVSHLIKDKGYSKDRAVAAAMSICKKVTKNEIINHLLATTIELEKLKNGDR